MNSFIINEVDMKKLFLLTALFCICAACESIEIIVSPAPDSDEIVTKSDYKVSQAEASEFVRIYKKDQDYTVSPVVEGSDTLLFVYNFNQGWLVIAGDKRINPIVGENKEGNLNIAEAPEVILSWLEERAYNIMMLRSDQTAIDNEHTFLWKNLSKLFFSVVRVFSADYSYSVEYLMYMAVNTDCKFIESKIQS